MRLLADQFAFDRDTMTYSAEASDLGIPPGFQFDARDEHTLVDAAGVETKLYLFQIVRLGPSLDIRYWMLAPATCGPDLRIQIFND